MLEPLEAYFRLLTQWNAKINLTALPLEAPTDQTFDRLLVEPLAAARQIPDTSCAWFDLGSGGGSPAIPLKIARPSLKLTMIESKERKGAFLREAARVLGLTETTVASERFEDLAKRPEFSASGELVTVRAVKVDAELFETAALFLGNGGRLLLFRSGHDASPNPSGFKQASTVQLTDTPPAFLSVYQRVFHVEQR